MAQAVQPPQPPDPLFVLRGSKDAVNCVQFYPSTYTEKGKLLSGCGCGEVRVWNLETRRSESVLDGHDGKSILWVQALGKNQIISQGRDGQILTWDIGEGRSDVTARLPSNPLTFCKCDIYNQGSPLVAAPGQDSEIFITDLNNKTVICGLKADKSTKKFGMPMCVKFIDASRLLIGYEAGQIALWDTSAQKMLDNKQCHSEAVMCLDYSTSSKRGVSGSADDKVKSWTLGELELTVLAESTITNPGLSDVSIRQDDKIVATAGWDSRIRLFGWKQLKPLAVLSYHRQTVHTVDFSPPLQEFSSAQILTAGSKDKHISLWSLYNPS